MLNSIFDWLGLGPRPTQSDVMDSELNRAVFASLDGTGSRNDAAAILAQVERNQGFRLLSEHPFSSSHAADWVRQTRIDPPLTTHEADPWEQFLASLSELSEDEMESRYAATLFPFFTETLFVPDGETFAGHYMLFDDGQYYEFGRSTWARYVAEWAEHVQWEACLDVNRARGEPLQIDHHAFNLGSVLEVYESTCNRVVFHGFGYERWLGEVLECVRINSIRTLVEAGFKVP